jgi:hypothetical protein
MATSSDDFKYDGQVTIQLTRHGDEISVWPSNGLKGGLAISLMDVEEPRTNVGIATPAEWDAFVAAGNAALGRPSTALSDDDKRAAVYRIQRAVPKDYAYSYTDLITDLSEAIGAELDRAAAREADADVAGD